MRKIFTLTVLLALTACSSNSAASVSGHSTAPEPRPTASKPLTAAAAFTQLSAAVPTAKQSGTVTAANDPNHLLGRPHQYTSKVTFADTRIKPADVEGTDKGDVERGGSIEVFATRADAKARATYIQGFARSMPALAEYDYVHATVLVRVSHYLTPSQAAGYQAVADKLG